MWAVSSKKAMDASLRMLDVVFVRELRRKGVKRTFSVGDAEWGEAYLIGPTQSIVACAEDGTSACHNTFAQNLMLLQR